ncbi:MAG: hypothetical protein HYR49_05255 [Gammaproteobacteria bacterium]|nr:hypothetical protein [Gammaproteobacteria bacterium]
MIQLLFESFHAATLTMGLDGALLLAGARERVLAWGIVFCLMAAAALLLWLLNVRRRIAVSMLVVSALIPLLVMPGLRRENIRVLPHRIVVDTGAWLLPARTAIDLTNLRQIRQQQTQFTFAGYIVEPNALWELEYADGSTRQILLNDFFTAHRMAIAQYLRDRGHVVL